MTSQEVKDLIKRELEGCSEPTDVNGLDLNERLIDPVKERYFSSVDESITMELWTVLEETSDRKGYKVTFDETDCTFGLGIMTDNNKLIDIGTYGSFLDAVRGM